MDQAAMQKAQAAAMDSAWDAQKQSVMVGSPNGVFSPPNKIAIRTQALDMALSFVDTENDYNFALEVAAAFEAYLTGE